jgi:mycothiol synthase
MDEASVTSVRAPAVDDVAAITEVWVASDVAHLGQPDSDEQDILEYWLRKNFDRENDAWVVQDGDRIVGYSHISEYAPPGTFQAVGVVHPEWWGRGIGSQLLDLAEARVNARGGRKVHQFINGVDTAGRDLLEGRGYQPIRYFWHMERPLDEDVAVVAPEGIDIVTLVRGRDERHAHDLIQDAFKEHWGYHPESFEDVGHIFFGEDYDPALCFAAMDGERMVGVSLSQIRVGVGYVADLGVLSEWRGRGLGETLLRRSCNEFRSRGLERAALDVDSENTTGATRLYERVGFKTMHRYDAWEKLLGE